MLSKQGQRQEPFTTFEQGRLEKTSFENINYCNTSAATRPPRNPPRNTPQSRSMSDVTPEKPIVIADATAAGSAGAGISSGVTASTAYAVTVGEERKTDDDARDDSQVDDGATSGAADLKVSNIKCNGCTPLACCDCSTKFIEPQLGFVKSETRCKFAKVSVVSSQEIYNDEDIRSVHVNKAPFNKRLFWGMVLLLVAGIVLIVVGENSKEEAIKEGDANAENEYLLYGLVAAALGLFPCAFFFFLQCCRPTLNVAVYTNRLAWIPLNWGILSESYMVRGSGPGLKIHDHDDIGHKLLCRGAAEVLASRHQGKDVPKEGISQELLITNRRIGFKRRKACCGNKITLENSLHTYKLDEVANCHADASCPLFFIIWCVWAAITGIIVWQYIDQCPQTPAGTATTVAAAATRRLEEDAPAPSSAMTSTPEQCGNLFQAMIIVGAILVIYGVIVPRLPGGIGFCRKSRVVVYFKSPSPLGCPGFINGKCACVYASLCSYLLRSYHAFVYCGRHVIPSLLSVSVSPLFPFLLQLRSDG